MPVPKFVEIKQYICQRIEAGEWPEYSQVASENQLAQQFSCSRMTARRALTELCEQGVLMRSQGLGTFVAELKSQSSMLAIRNIADEIKERGHGYSVQPICVEPRLAQAKLAVALGVPNDTQLAYSELVHCEDGYPIQLEQRFVNPELVPDYLKQSFESLTPHEYLSRHAPLTQATHTIEAIAADQAIAERLQIALGEPCLQISRRTWSSQGVVSFALLTHPGSRYRLGGQLPLHES
ncbi:histidine utilization repressor [Paraferrimonas sedimenticola]|uniref:Histidine utilization repressor n=1 Tax=Paraferrimonas sedimenticola TaxID=375674 RepID=A0AA37VTM2_9GAMM|nr:histidine utilization repressor [Paraferrimonas sedimenticola]GLP95424.1 histidine utilization repressor [Paraferrimonas sedimenticola]